MSHDAVSRKMFPGGAFLSTVPCFRDLILFIQYLTEGHSEIVKIVLGHVASRCVAEVLSLALRSVVCHRGCRYYVRNG